MPPRLQVQPHLALLSGLHTLKLHGCLLDFPAGLMPCFPPAVKRLELQGSAGLVGRLPQQVRSKHRAHDWQHPGSPIMCSVPSGLLHSLNWRLPCRGLLVN